MSLPKISDILKLCLLIVFYLKLKDFVHHRLVKKKERKGHKVKTHSPLILEDNTYNLIGV